METSDRIEDYYLGTSSNMPASIIEACHELYPNPIEAGITDRPIPHSEPSQLEEKAD